MRVANPKPAMALSILSRSRVFQRFALQRRLLASKKSVSEVLSSAPKLHLKREELRDYQNDPFERSSQRPSPRGKTSARNARPRREKERESVKGRRPEPKRNSEETSSSPTAASYVKKFENVRFVPTEEFVQAQKPRNEDVPKLAHKLDRVLFSPGVHFLQDPRTRIYNFPPHLKSIVPYHNFDFEKILTFVSASKDKTLLEAAIKNKRTFYSSTSSMTLTLHQLYLFLNNYSSNESSQDRFDFPKFTKNATDMPLSVIVEPKGVNDATGETIYSVTSDKSTDVEILLSAMGHCLETLLTTEEEEFKEYLLDQQSAERTPAAEDLNPNIYNYLAYGDFLMRSQLDCYDPRLPGNGTFDLKTRAVCAIRYDKALEKTPTSYQIWKLNGKVESFEREYQDLIRTGGLLKYSFQARIGQMDGIFVAYHNISSFFGFQYLPLSELDKVFYSHAALDDLKANSVDASEIEAYDTHATHVAEAQFKLSLSIWQDVMKTAIKDLAKTKYKGMPFRLVMKRAVKPVVVPGEIKTRREIREGPHDSFLRVFVMPITKESVEQLQGFSTQLQTSFRDDITTEQKVENLTETRENLDAFNEKLLEDSMLLSYNIRANFYASGEHLSGRGKHPYPMSSKEESNWRYRIDQVIEPENEPDSILKSRYLDLLKKATSLLTMSHQERPKLKSGEPSLLENLRIYSEIGKKRLEKWKDDETPPKVF